MMIRQSTKSRYCYNTAVYGKVGRRLTIWEQIKKWRHDRKRAKPDLYPVTGYYPMIYPEK